MAMTRREILVGAGGIIAATAGASSESTIKTHDSGTTHNDRPRSQTKSHNAARSFISGYQGDYLNQIAFPLGGIGAGMFCLEGAGALTKFSLRNRPDLGNEPHAFAAVYVKGPRNIARVLEG